MDGNIENERGADGNLENERVVDGNIRVRGS